MAQQSRAEVIDRLTKRFLNPARRVGRKVGDKEF